jgi:hypothetical protein
MEAVCVVWLAIVETANVDCEQGCFLERLGTSLINEHQMELSTIDNIVNSGALTGRFISYRWKRFGFR